ncbi:uncharacterized protein MICPUCDRAFT_66605 [Micromonas pusilla CCMP1545]|uniref:Predicted protein n=1 Tax=Micromonas pusilla (strain CCMP1545) TaxID=564608 RepID=C1N979_MICPC|nr:uncharacterized protein MICPUCDRAFT_66605 [Micromonas pusilla CCMP1545]EEH51476.1 predicted protein [Micromonas pusilla CCMP1545]|eukprot:XP_003064571.1 predicted protein [Micromonas pusilla CCMP1545]
MSEMERAHDAIGPAFEKLIADAEAELVARRSNSTPLTVATVPVRTVHANELSLEDFIENHALPGVPVVIQGLNVTPPDAPRWTLKHFVDVCGDVNVTLNKKGADTDNWGGLVTAGRLTLREFVASHATDDDRKRWYLHDWSLNRECPDVFGPPPYDRFLVPKYFAGDYFQRVPWVSYEHTWPSLFVGAANTSSALHTDSGATNFWMYLLSGAKRWRFWPRTTSFHLYLKPMSSHYRVDAFNLNLTERPLLADAPMWEVTQRPGDLVFVPSNAPHAVHNDEDTVGISMNYVDASNVVRSIHWSPYDRVGVVNADP